MEGETRDKSSSSILQPYSPSSHQTQSGDAHSCEVCGACFETKRGLSSHARSHLRQLGVAVSDSSGAPIDLLYQLIQERDGRLPFPSSGPKTPKSNTKKPSPKKESGTKLKIKISNLVKKSSRASKPPPPTEPPGLSSPVSDYDSDSSASTPPPSTAKPQNEAPERKKVMQYPSLSPSAPSTPSLSLTKPLWAPQDTDAPLKLAASQRDDVHVCELCGAWYETRKGLSSHARAHLRQFGVELDVKGGPIKRLHMLLQREDRVCPYEEEEERGSNSSASSSSSSSLSSSSSVPSTSASIKRPPPSTALPLTPAPKKVKTAPVGGGEKQKGDDLVKECEFCHETFKTKQSLASHARCHLRQLGVTEWTVQGSPIATLRELMTKRGCSILPKPRTQHKTSPTSSSAPPSRPSLASPSPTDPSPPPPPRPPSLSPRVPKARKGFRTVVPKPKEEPVEVDVCVVESPKARSTATTTPTTPQSWSSPVNAQTSHPALKPKLKPETAPALSVRCKYCSEMFDTRKALSCHARAHLRQLGVKWSPNNSPIDTLYQLMLREGGAYRGSEVKAEPAWRTTTTASPQTVTPSPVDYREKVETLEGGGAGCDARCDLCGFDFENRKALASHARAHLRQVRVEWRAGDSPILALQLWMRKEPARAQQLQRRYTRGDLPVNRRGRSIHGNVLAPSHSDPAPTSAAGHASSSSSHRKLHTSATHTTEHIGRLARACERRPPKHSEGRLGEAGPLKSSRAGNAPSLMPRPPESSLVKLVGKMYQLKCRFCEEVFRGPLSVQEDWLIHLRQHILNLKQESAPVSDPAPVSAPSDPAPVSAPSNPAPVSAPSDPAPVSAPGDPAPVSAPGDPAPVSAPSDPAPVSAPSDPAPVSAPSDPAPVSAPSDPAPVSAPGDPAPVSAPSDPAPVSAPSDPAPVSAPGDPAPVSTPGDPAPVSTPGDPAPVSTPGDPAPVSAPSDSVSPPSDPALVSAPTLPQSDTPQPIGPQSV